MRLISNEELALVSGGTDQTVEVRGKRMTPAEKDAYDQSAARIANGMSACALGDIVGCGLYINDLKSEVNFPTQEQESLIDWNLVSG